MFGGNWKELVTKLVHRAYSGVRPLAKNIPCSTRIASCALLCEALVAIFLGLGGDAFDMRGNTSLIDFI